MLYPALVDRYRVAQVLIQGAWRTRRRSKRGLNQAALARAASVSQPTIPIAMNLGDIAEKHALGERRLIERDTLLSVLVRGLHVERSEADLILWLYDGQPLEDFEVMKFFKDPLSGKIPVYTESALRQATLDRVRRALPGSEGSPHQATVEILFRRDEQTRLAAEKKLLELESLPGQRLVASRYPSFVTTPKVIAKQNTDVEPGIVSPAIRTQYKRTLLERVEVFERHLLSYGERAIYSKPDLEAYARRDSTDWRSPTRRRAQLAHCADLLLEHPDRFQIALTEQSPELEMSLKIGARAAIRGTPSSKGPLQEGWGVRYLIWRDLASVYSFVCEFEDRWDSIPKADRDNEAVARTIRRFLENG